MATIEILAWKEHFVGGTAWDGQAKSEFKKRLRRGIKASPSEIRRLARCVDGREIMCLCDVHDEAVLGLTQILQAMGADIRVALADPKSPTLFRRTPRR